MHAFDNVKDGIKQMAIPSQFDSISKRCLYMAIEWLSSNFRNIPEIYQRFHIKHYLISNDMITLWI